MNISKHRFSKCLPILAAISLPLVLGACSSSSSSAPPPKPSVDLAADVAVTEGNTGITTMTFTVTLSAATNTAVDVTYSTADGTATTADNDYVAASGTVSFDANETSKTIDVTVRGDTTIDLTPREHAVLETLMRRHPDVVPKQELIDDVWGIDFDGDPNIVEVYVGYLRRKVDAPFDTPVIETVRGHGYRFVR